MLKSYQDYCREAVQRDPKTYGSICNEDGSRKPAPRLSDMYRSLCVNSIPKNKSKKIKCIPWVHQSKVKPIVVKNAEPPYDEPQLKIIGTEFRLKGRKLNLTMMEMPKNPTRQQYNKTWMNNERVRHRIKKLKEQYGTTVTL